VLDDLLAEIDRQGGHAGDVGREPVISLELFFEGNDDPGSIGCNLPDHPGVHHFYTVLRHIRDRADVHDVRIGITEVMSRDEWPFSPDPSANRRPHRHPVVGLTGYGTSPHAGGAAAA
jgi:hypothetical protein